MRARDVFEGVSVGAFARGTRRMLTPLTTRHATASAEHTQVLAGLREQRAKARAIADPEERARVLDGLKRPIHPTLVAAGCTVAAVVVGWPTLHGHHEVVLAGTATLWVIAALIIGQTSPTAVDSDTDEHAEGVAPAADEPPEEDLQDHAGRAVPTPAGARLAVAILGADGTHVALTAVTAHLAAAHPLWKRSGKAVRELLREARVEVRAGVRVEGVSVAGVHRDDVPPLPHPVEGTPVDVVVAGQSNNNNANNTEWTTGDGFVMRACDDNPARTIVISHPDTTTP